MDEFGCDYACRTVGEGFAGKIIQRKGEMQLYKNFRIKENPKPSNNHFDGLGLLRLR